jgi:hypothetical protein
MPESDCPAAKREAKRKAGQAGRAMVFPGCCEPRAVNFNNVLSRNGLLMSFDAATQINTPGVGGWTGVIFGASEANRLGFMNGNFEHFGILLCGNGLFEA